MRFQFYNLKTVLGYLLILLEYEHSQFIFKTNNNQYILQLFIGAYGPYDIDIKNVFNYNFSTSKLLI